MKVKLLVPAAIDGMIHRKGEVVDIPNDQAKAWIANKICEVVERKETADLEKKVKKTTRRKVEH